jgi:ERCC4-related helicase
MTPQTLENDLNNELVDARDIVLLVIGKYHPFSFAMIYRSILQTRRIGPPASTRMQRSCAS